MRVLLVEDDGMIGEAVSAALRQDGAAVDWTRDGKAADLALQAERYELVLLDLGLPSRDGLEVLRALRARKDRTPVLIVTARDAVHERIAGLDAGADDYLVKPFDLDELAARMRSLLRRSAGRAAPVFEHLGVTFNPATREVTRHNEPLTLSARELAVLQALLERPGAVLSRAQLEERLYGWGEEIESNTIEVYVHGLRRKLGADFIRTVRGVGYMVPKA
jgi:two-component system, OmpR family, response regulator